MSLYDSKRWRDLRELKLWDNPYCEICKGTFNLQIDHIIEHKNREDLFWNENNLQTLCISCHGKKSSFESSIQLIKQGDYILTLKNEDNKELKKYIDFYDNIYLAIKTYCKEFTFNHVNNVINIGNLKLNVIHELISSLVLNFNLKPKKILIDETNKYFDLLKQLII